MWATRSAPPLIFCLLRAWIVNQNYQLLCSKVVYSSTSIHLLAQLPTGDPISSVHQSHSPQLPRALIDDLPIESVDKTKLLGVTINPSLTWNDHIEEPKKKASRKLYFLVQLKRAQIPFKDLAAYSCACIRSSLDYTCPLFHYAFPKYLQLDLERVQKRALSFVGSLLLSLPRLSLLGPTITITLNQRESMAKLVD